MPENRSTRQKDFRLPLSRILQLQVDGEEEEEEAQC